MVFLVKVWVLFLAAEKSKCEDRAVRGQKTITSFISGVSAVLHSRFKLVRNSRTNKASIFNSFPRRETGSFCHSRALKLARQWRKFLQRGQSWPRSAEHEAELLRHTFLTKRKMCCELLLRPSSSVTVPVSDPFVAKKSPKEDSSQ